MIPPQCEQPRCGRYMTYLGAEKEGNASYIEMYRCFSCHADKSVERRGIPSHMEKMLLTIHFKVKSLPKAA